ncbi:hypothetical protein LJ707_06245 [Mucilaginibacter sp. UR6-1]|uniref:CcoQ/FixQ family Cbb3-type cytochrome c oxidase assembly chaperone n=1 Tax=Mucilaginibacter roseus TaxID=1528868 RepID=A0ABS8U144_9SPHI|nr:MULTISPECIES: hypothetical protein [Mucilaginibacter]MCC8408523.1 hypothetical protein [Mucilaginibacter sp. UR6-1]MCD8740824.1 hypothetical protein [Mucilaginibacter roseus]
MFKQFVQGIDGNQVYLITSLAIFLLFFIVVTVMLIRIKKPHADYMSDIPLSDNQPKHLNIQEL